MTLADTFVILMLSAIIAVSLGSEFGWPIGIAGAAFALLFGCVAEACTAKIVAAIHDTDEEDES